MSTIPSLIILPFIAFIGVCVCFVVYAIWNRLRAPRPPDAMMQILMFVGGMFLSVGSFNVRPDPVPTAASIGLF